MHQMTDDSFEDLLKSFPKATQINLRDVTYVDPFSMIGLLILGERAKKNGLKKAVTLTLPSSVEVLNSLEQMGFLKLADKCYKLERPAKHDHDRAHKSFFADVLLEIMPIEKAEDMEVVGNRIRERSPAVLEGDLRYDERAVRGFSLIVSEVCENIVEHSENKGFIGIQKHYSHDASSTVVSIAVMDTGIGFKNSLSDRFLLRNDLHALEKALLQGASRHVDDGKGHGLTAVKRFVTRHNGKLSVRSGTARLSFLPKWAKGSKKDFNLVHFPGVQISIMLPAL